MRRGRISVWSGVFAPVMMSPPTKLALRASISAVERTDLADDPLAEAGREALDLVDQRLGRVAA